MAAPKFFGLLFVVAAATISAASANIHFTLYITAVYEGPLQSSFVVAGLNNTSGFGTIRVNDNVVRDGQATTSAIVGREQGFSALVSLDGTTQTTPQTLVFTAGQYAGSSISAVGRFSFAPNVVSELPIVGGTGQFRFARGYVLGSIVTSFPAFNVFKADFTVLL